MNDSSLIAIVMSRLNVNVLSVPANAEQEMDFGSNVSIFGNIIKRIMIKLIIQFISVFRWYNIHFI